MQTNPWINKVELMKYFIFLFCAFLPIRVLSNPLLPLIPQNQYLAALNYFRNGEPSGCGLRITGITKDELWINALVMVSMKESGNLFGVFKVEHKKITMKDDKPLILDGKVVYSSAGNIYKGWIKTDSGFQFLASKDGGDPHNDGYMAPMEFGNAVNLLIAIQQENFRVGFNRKGDETEYVYEFNERITQKEAANLLSCMNSLKDAREGKGL